MCNRSGMHCKYGFVAPLGSRHQGIPPASFRFFSQSCTKACLCSEQAGPNSHPVLQARSAQTGGPETPGREGRAFHLLFPISFAKYNWLLKKIHSARRYTLKAPISCRAVGWMILQFSRIILPIVGEDIFMRRLWFIVVMQSSHLSADLYKCTHGIYLFHFPMEMGT